jgi:hypothetical protein
MDGCNLPITIPAKAESIIKTGCNPAKMPIEIS